MRTISSTLMEQLDNSATAVIADIVGSRRIEDRASAQGMILEAFTTALGYVQTLERPRETVGDEFQAVFPTRADALVFTAVVPLLLHDGLQLRFGLGSGLPRTVTPSGIQDGPAWWAARSAVDEAGKRQRGRFPTTRSWFQDGLRQGGDASSLRDVRLDEALVNAYLVERDATIARLGDREKGWLLELLAGRSQREVAASGGLSQPAVSQALGRLGGIQLLEGIKLLRRATT